MQTVSAETTTVRKTAPEKALISEMMACMISSFLELQMVEYQGILQGAGAQCSGASGGTTAAGTS